jgi:hypothetical protein
MSGQGFWEFLARQAILLVTCALAAPVYLLSDRIRRAMERHGPLLGKRKFIFGVVALLLCGAWAGALILAVKFWAPTLNLRF